MNNKQRLLPIIGTVSFLSGALVILAVLSFWLIVPIFPPPSLGLSDNNPISDSDLAELAAGPALSPFTPPKPEVNNDQILLPSTTEFDNQMENPQSTENDNRSFFESMDWRVFAYPDGNRGKSSNSGENLDEMRVVIPAIDVDAPLLPVGLFSSQSNDGRAYQQWAVPNEYAAGWHESSAPPGRPGNTVLNGHNNIHGAIFHDLVDLPLGAQIIIFNAGQSFVYEVTGREFLLEQGEPLRSRLRNARWILPTNDERITLVTCWPNSTNTHRLVLVAQPVEST